MVSVRFGSSTSLNIRSFVFVLLALLVSACGGGSGGDGGGASSNADLGNLTLSTGSLDQIFQSEQTSYTATVGFLVASLELIATADDADATVQIDGATVASGKPGRIDLAEGQNTFEIVVTTADGATTRTYDLEITRQAVAQFAQQAYIKASNTGDSDFFGFSVALAGDTLAVGARREESNATGVSTGGSGENNDDAGFAGAVYVFTRDGDGLWSQQAYIKASNTDGGDNFGYSVALAGDTLAVGARKEESDGSGEDDNSAFFAGAVYVFTRDGTAWSQQAYIKASNTDPFDEFGTSVALAGDTLAVGASDEDSNATGVNDDEASNNDTNAGAVYVFTRDNGVWSQQAYVKASNTDRTDEFGTSVALAGDTLAVGAINEDSNDTGVNSGGEGNSGPDYDAGAVYVFTRDGSTWSQQAYVKASNTDSADRFGTSVALAGDTLAVGAIGEGSNGSSQDNDSASNAGAVYVFTRDGNGLWSQQAYLKASNTDADDEFGGSVALAGDTLAVGAKKEDSIDTGVNGNQADNSAGGAGAVYMFTRDGTGAWSQQAYVKASNTDANGGDNFGHSVALAGGTLAVGANAEDSDDTGVRIGSSGGGNNSAANSGAVYIRR
jgi:hypothetical protein